jgi:hypothetical protein
LNGFLQLRIDPTGCGARSCTYRLPERPSCTGLGLIEFPGRRDPLFQQDIIVSSSLPPSLAAAAPAGVAAAAAVYSGIDRLACTVAK